MGEAGPHRVISLPDTDPDLTRGVPPEDEQNLRIAAQLPVWRLEPGAWEPPARTQAAFAALIVDGLLTHEIQVVDRVTAQLFGPGDILQPWSPSGGSVPAAARWLVNEPATLAVFDARWLLAARRWPALSVRLHERLSEQAQRAAAHAAIVQVTGVELRVLGLLWHLSDRWGKVSTGGVIVPLRLTHEALGRLVGAQRPTITLALGALEREGLVARRAQGGWVLRSGSHRQLAPEHPIAPLGPLAAGLARDVLGPPAAPAAATAPAGVDVAALRTLVAELRTSLEHRRRRVLDLAEECRATAERSRELRARIASQRAARRPVRPRVP